MLPQPKKCFVSLPEEAVKAGVKRFGFRGTTNSEAYEDDVVAVQHVGKPSGYADSAITNYETNGPFKLSNLDRDVVVGTSLAGQVSGKHLIKCKNHYVFLEDQGEPGNSGTLMCAPNSDSGELQLLGTYFGTMPENGRVASTRPRGIVAPLPEDPATGFNWLEPIDAGRHVKLRLCHSRGMIRCTAPVQAPNRTRYSLLSGEGWR